MELIILDDASKDNTVERITANLKKLHKKFNRVIFMKNNRNEGNISRNCNKMLKEACGQYVKIIAADDIMRPSCVSELVNSMLLHPECAVVYANMYVVDDNYKLGDSIEGLEKQYLPQQSVIKSINLFRKLMFGNFIAAPTCLVKREIYEKYGAYDENMVYEDYEFWLRISRTESFFYLNRTVVFYRRAENSITNFEDGNKHRKIETAMKEIKKAVDKYMEYLSVEDQTKSKKLFYETYWDTCTKAKYIEGIRECESNLKEMGVWCDGERREMSPNYMNMYNKQGELLNLLDTWLVLKQQGTSLSEYFEFNEYYKIAIYGGGRLGQRLCAELENTKIHIAYIVDQNADMLLPNHKAYTIDDELESVDAIVVTPVGVFSQVVEELRKKIECPIVNIADIIDFFS